MSGVVYTGRWHLLRRVPPSAIVPVRTSVGAARFITGARSLPAIDELIPFGLLDVDEPAEFTRRYCERLERHGVGRIQARFDELRRDFPGRPLVLLCFEADRRDCHQGDFADWWQEKTGVLVPEFSASTRTDLAPGGPASHPMVEKFQAAAVVARRRTLLRALEGR